MGNDFFVMATRRMDVVLAQTEIRRPLIRARFVNIEKQKAAVSKMAQVDLPEVAGFEMLEGQMKLEKMNKEIVDAFVEEMSFKWWKNSKIVANDMEICEE